MVIQGISYPSDFEAKKQMIELGRRMDEKGCVVAGEGSLSVRVGPNAVWITAEGAEKGSLKQENFIRVDMNGKQAPGSRNTRLPEDVDVHLAVYGQNPALRGIIHGYPVGAVAFGALGLEVTPADYTPSVRALGRISLVQRGDAEHCKQAAVLACRSDAGILIVGDGCMMWGESLADAFHKMEALEYYVKVSRLLCGGRAEGTAAQMRTGSPSVQMSHPAVQAGSPSVQMSYPAVQAGSPAEISSPVEMSGLTPLIRPGDREGFRLPSGGAVQTPVSMTGASERSFVSTQTSDVSAESRREQMMAEVVRRSMASMR